MESSKCLNTVMEISYPAVNDTLVETAVTKSLKKASDILQHAQRKRTIKFHICLEAVFTVSLIRSN